MNDCNFGSRSGTEKDALLLCFHNTRPFRVLCSGYVPGRIGLGVRLFFECCALEKVGIISEGTSKLAIGAVMEPYAL